MDNNGSRVLGNKEKNLIKASIIVVIIIIIAIIACIKYLKKSENEEKRTQNEGVQAIGLEGLNRTKDVSLYFTIDECIKSYLKMIKAQQGEILISYLNEEYLDKNHINLENVFTIIRSYNDYNSYRTMEMFEKFNIENSSATYMVKGKIDGSYIFLNVGIDEENETFDICPMTEEEYNKSITNEEKDNKSAQSKISKKIYNFYRKSYITDEELSRMYYVDYIKMMLKDAEQAYSMLNVEYRNLKFGDIEAFKRYINQNKQFLTETYNVETADSSNFNGYAEYAKYIESKSKFKMKNYVVNQYEEYTQLVCGNVTGNNLIFNAKYPMDYEVYLDTYTIDLPEFINKYKAATNKNKMLMNVEKVKGAVNIKDYSYVYNKLDETFKKNNFQNETIFKEYLNNHLFEYNNFEYDSVNEEAGILVTTLKITDATNQNTAPKSMTIIMKLSEENTDFVMSFSFK